MSTFISKRVLKLIFGTTLASLLVWLILRHIDLPSLSAIIAEAHFEWLVIAVGFFLIGYACRVTRWRLMLLCDNPEISWIRCAVPFMGSIAANNVLPFRAGDALRAFAFSAWLGVPNSAVIATLLVERLLDLLSLLIVLGIVLMVFDLGDGALGTLLGMSGTGLIAIGVGVSLLLLFPRLVQPVVQMGVSGLARLSPKWEEPMSAVSARIFDTLFHLAQGTRMSRLVLWSAAVWGFEGCVFWATARALPALSDPLVGFLALPVGTLATLLPSTPGYVGTFDFFVMKALELFDNSAVASVAFALLVHLILWMPATIIGGVCIAFWVITRKRDVP